ncbi:MAG: hypothetical protein HY344_01095 [Candidatus Levybacteria bacterium]|nr:hypothetical protein [Candidatus Levybacteria bacterium]
MTVERVRFSPRQTVDTSTARARRLTTTSWDTAKGMLELRTHNKRRLHGLFVNNQDFLRSYFETVYTAVAAGEKPEKPNSDDPRNRTFSAHFRIIREAVTHESERPSHGWAVHERRRKAATRNR